MFPDYLKEKLCDNVGSLIDIMSSSKNQDFAACLNLYSISREDAMHIALEQLLYIDGVKMDGRFLTYPKLFVEFWRKNLKEYEIEFWKKWRDKNTKNGKIIKKE